MKKTFGYVVTAFVTTVALGVAATGAARAVEVSQETPEVVASRIKAAEIDPIQLEIALKAIEDIPDSALSSESAFENWKAQNLASAGETRASVLACAGAVTVAIASNLFVFSKVAKLKTVIKAAGGAGKVASAAIDAYKAARAANKSRAAAIAEASEKVAVNGGEQATSLLLEFFSIDGVVDGCFSD